MIISIVTRQLRNLFLISFLLLYGFSACLADTPKHSPHKVKQISHANKTSKKLAHKTNKNHFAPRQSRNIKQHTHKHFARNHRHLISHLASTRVKHPIVSVPNVVDNSDQPRGFVASIQHSLVSFVHSTVATLSYSAYKLGGRLFDSSRGVYILDCSNYVDNVLKKANPHAYSSLVYSSGTDQPTSLQYYDFFTGLSDEPSRTWNPIKNVRNLEPGDILVFRKKNLSGARAAGHVMIVMRKPEGNTNAMMVRVADSAPTGHSQDTRQPHVSGIGIGNLLLKVDPKTGEPFAYAWKVGSHWKRNVNFAMARPVGIMHD